MIDYAFRAAVEISELEQFFFGEMHGHFLDHQIFYLGMIEHAADLVGISPASGQAVDFAPSH
jgi:hypothetical protein